MPWKDINKRREYDRKRSKTTKRKLANKLYKKTIKGRQVQKKALLKWKSKNIRKMREEHYKRKSDPLYLLKKRCRDKTRSRIQKVPKEFCIHHPDYTKPWLYQLLTKKSHIKLHGKSPIPEEK
jgi:hypothetical protein